eukprot:scaffold5207_cov84-Skeletonema_marinoi.AAC.8
MDAITLSRASLACRSWNRLANSNELWNELWKEKFGILASESNSTNKTATPRPCQLATTMTKNTSIGTKKTQTITHIDSPLDATASPLNVRWQYSTSDEAFDQRLEPDLQKELIETSFFCAVCNNNTNLCSYGAVCQLDDICGYCPNDSSGTMCQIPPTSNGHCDPYFNNINFGFDGGDCCESTCRSTPENTCGKSGQGYIDIGYPSCVRASNKWELSRDPIYGVSVRQDPAGAEWIERGQVQGPPDSDFGLAISLSDESFNIARNPYPYSSPTITLAVGAPNAKFELGLSLVRVFKCSTTNGCLQKGDDIVGDGSFGNSVSIAKDGYERLAAKTESIESLRFRSGLGIALSGKGTILAVADPGVSIVRLFDKAGAEWTERGQYIQVQGPSETDFGVAISLADESDYHTQSSFLANGHSCGRRAEVGVSSCLCLLHYWMHAKRSSIVGSVRFGNSVSIAKNGNTIAVGGADKQLIVPLGENNDGGVRVFTWLSDTNDWQQKGNVTIVRPTSRKLMTDQYSLQGYKSKTTSQ